MKTYIFTTKGCRQKTPVRVLGFFAVLIGAGCQTPHTSTGTDAQGTISLRHVHTHERLDHLYLFHLSGMGLTRQS